MNEIPNDSQPYVMSRQAVWHPADHETVVVVCGEEQLELSFLTASVLGFFATPRTLAAAFEQFSDISSEQIAAVVGSFVDAGALVKYAPSPRRETGIAELLNPDIFSDSARVEQMSRALRENRLVLVQDAFREDYAHRMRELLVRERRWQPYFGSIGMVHSSNMNVSTASFGPELRECADILGSDTTKRYMENLSGRSCDGPLELGAAWYRPGDYALPHQDVRIVDTVSREVAFVWYLSTDWEPEWGGSFFWCKTGTLVAPKFNSLALFNVSADSVHMVCPVSNQATGKRLSIHGWWNTLTEKTLPYEHPTQRGTWLYHYLKDDCIEGSDSAVVVV